MRAAGLIICALAAAMLPATAATAAPPLPFGHSCSPRDGVLFCPTAGDSQRVPSFDGVPLDVDVTLPATGDGPFPTVVMLHGMGLNKLMLESNRAEPGTSLGIPAAGPATAEHYNNLYYAQQGFAVVNASSRGFGRSCGVPDSRTPGCARGWLHFLDTRYEARDVQHLLGVLVDEGVADPAALGATGYSMGGGVALRLAFLRDRVRMPDGTLVPWTSPAGVPLRFSAVFARWGSGDGAANTVPNGRAADLANPIGVVRVSALDFLYGLAQSGFLTPAGADPSADLTGWRAALERGEPYGSAARAAVAELTAYHGALPVFDGRASPLILEAGFTDEVTGIDGALRVYRLLLGSGSPVALLAGDLGHFRGSNHPDVVTDDSDQGLAFLSAHLLGRGAAPAQGAVRAHETECRTGVPAALHEAASFDALTRTTLVLRSSRRRTVTSTGGSPATAAAETPQLGAGVCVRPAVDHARGVWRARWRKAGLLVAGTPVLSAEIATHGGPGQLVARLWDVGSDRHERLIARSVYRLNRDQKGRVRMSLPANLYRLATGHSLDLELLGRDPRFTRPSNGRFRVRVSRVSLALPVG